MKKNVKRSVYLGLLTALAFVLSYVETLIPINLGVPGAKLGLANLVVVVALYTLGVRDAFVLSIIRMILAGFTFGNMTSLLYSLAGGLLSFGVMLLAKKTKFFSLTGVSVLGGVFHNVGQLLMAIFMLKTTNLLYYLPVLVFTGCLAGVAIGMLGAQVTGRIQKIVSATVPKDLER